MPNAVDVANFFIDLANASDDCMTNLKLNKLLYFAQAWSLVRRNAPLFNENIQAWDLGPVTPSVYHEFKKYGKERIAAVSGAYDQSAFSPDEFELLIDVAREYGKYSAPALVDMSHEINGPWYTVHGSKKRVIPQDLIKEYFQRQTPLQSFLSSGGEFVGYRDSEGYLVLPGEMNDTE